MKKLEIMTTDTFRITELSPGKGRLYSVQTAEHWTDQKQAQATAASVSSVLLVLLFHLYYTYLVVVVILLESSTLLPFSFVYRRMIIIHVFIATLDNKRNAINCSRGHTTVKVRFCPVIVTD